MRQKAGQANLLPFSVLAPLLSVLPAGVALYLYAINQTIISLPNRLYFIIPLTLGLLALLIIPHTKTRAKYYTVQALAVICCLLTSYSTIGLPAVQVIILFIFLIELILYEPYPLNLFHPLGLTLLATLLNFSIMYHRGASPIALVNHTSVIFIAGTTLAIFGSLMVKHRELVVDLVEDRNRLRDSVVSLTRTNSAYQDYAVVAQEHATEKERRRITRDIHDIVGYTLTNNMMLMEAALDLMKENALALPTIIETARENAAEGLDQVRSAMYKLRKQENTFPIGLKAIVRLGRIFQQATGIKVQYNFCNMPMMISDQVDSAVYHLIQEALVNSFRHGGATEVHVSFWYDRQAVQIHIRDNGMGAAEIIEGIGIQGMRERIEKLGGTVQTGSMVEGFLVNATIPLPGMRDERQDPGPYSG